MSYFIGKIGQLPAQRGAAGDAVAGGLRQRRGAGNQRGIIAREPVEGAVGCQEGPPSLDRVAHLEHLDQQRGAGPIAAPLRTHPLLQRRKPIAEIRGGDAEPAELLICLAASVVLLAACASDRASIAATRPVSCRKAALFAAAAAWSRSSVASAASSRSTRWAWAARLDLIASTSAAGGAGRASSAATRAARSELSDATGAGLAAHGNSGATAGAQNGDSANPAITNTSSPASHSAVCQKSAAGRVSVAGCAATAGGTRRSRAALARSGGCRDLRGSCPMFFRHRPSRSRSVGPPIGEEIVQCVEQRRLFRPLSDPPLPPRQLAKRRIRRCTYRKGRDGPATVRHTGLVHQPGEDQGGARREKQREIYHLGAYRFSYRRAQRGDRSSLVEDLALDRKAPGAQGAGEVARDGDCHRRAADAPRADRDGR